MKERPILFSAPMVRAILEGRKTQTRRVMLPQTSFETTGFFPFQENGLWANKHASLSSLYDHAKNKRFSDMYKDGRKEVYLAKCPYGVIGDRLWVRETFTDSEPIFYRATLLGHLKDSDYIWKPSIFMPRKASRITLEITNVRVERIQDISELDARAEGVVWQRDFGDGIETRDARVPFGDLWHALNDSRGFGWNVNPWVWVIEFRKESEPK